MLVRQNRNFLHQVARDDISGEAQDRRLAPRLSTVITDCVGLARMIFPFGFGLSYTTFTFDHLSISPQGASGQVHVTVDVTNTESVDVADVVQLYVVAPAKANKAPRQLKGFAKVSPAPGQTKHVSLMLDPRAFSVWDSAANRWSIVAGRHEISIGDFSRNLPLHSIVEILGPSR